MHGTLQKPSNPTHHIVQEQRVDVQSAAISQTCTSGEPRRCKAWWQLAVTGSADDAGTKKIFAQLGQRLTWSVGGMKVLLWKAQIKPALAWFI